MEEKKTIVTENRHKIKKVHFKYPELMAENAEKKIEEEYYMMLYHDSRLHDLRDEIRELEETLKSLKKAFEEKSHLFDIEFETEASEYTTHKNTVMITGCGNSTLGTSIRL